MSHNEYILLLNASCLAEVLRELQQEPWPRPLIKSPAQAFLIHQSPNLQLGAATPASNYLLPTRAHQIRHSGQKHSSHSSGNTRSIEQTDFLSFKSKTFSAVFTNFWIKLLFVFPFLHSAISSRDPFQFFPVPVQPSRTNQHSSRDSRTTRFLSQLQRSLPQILNPTIQRSSTNQLTTDSFYFSPVPVPSSSSSRLREFVFLSPYFSLLLNRPSGTYSSLLCCCLLGSAHGSALGP